MAEKASGTPLPEHVTLPLLALITQRSLDADYEHVAARRRAAGTPAGEGRPIRSGTAALVLFLFGLLVAVAAVQTSRNAPVDQASRAGLIDQINLRRQTVTELQHRLADAQSAALALRRTLARGSSEQKAAEARLEHLQVRTGFGAVHGPGIEASVSSAPGSDTTQLVRDSDLALLADALWAAGAEAISVNGQRLTVLSSFRNVGIGILVNAQPVNPPYVFDVVGDPNTLAANLLFTSAGGEWYALKDSFGFRFTVKDGGTMSLPAAPARHLRSVRVADPKNLDSSTQGDSSS